MSDETKGARPDLLTRYKKALEGLTPGGSEFVDDPERCAAWARERQASLHRQLLQAKVVGPVRGAREAAERVTCSACGHVHQLGRITCGHFIRTDPHQGEICCECVAAPEPQGAMPPEPSAPAETREPDFAALAKNLAEFDDPSDSQQKIVCATPPSEVEAALRELRKMVDVALGIDCGCFSSEREDWHSERCYKTFLKYGVARAEKALGEK